MKGAKRIIAAIALTLGLGTGVQAADIVVVVDESGSMSGEHAWIGGMIGDLDTALNAAGVTGNTYSLVGFGSATIAPRTLLNAGTVADFQTADDLLLLNGGTEDGYAGIQHALGGSLTLTSSALNVILITDEDRDNWNTAYNYANTLAALSGDGDGALLNAVVNANFGTGVLGVDSDGNRFTADGSGGFTTTAGSTTGAVLSDSGTTEQDYVDMAWATGGASWNLNLLRAGGLSATSFSAAFVDIKVQEIVQQTGSVPEPASLALMGIGLLGMGFGRKVMKSKAA